MQHLIIVGLGNVGQEYKDTRHNLGIQTVEAWAGDSVWKQEERFMARVVATPHYTALFPLTYMNNSGQAVAAFLNFKKLTPQHLIVIHDEVELELGQVRWKDSGSAAGHNGVRSLIDSLGTDQFKRLRLGIGRPPAEVALNRFVLEKFTDQEEKVVQEMIGQAVQELSTIVQHLGQE